MSPIPSFLSHLKTDRGYPIPYFAAFVDGRVDFRMMDAKRQRVCMAYRKCAVCSKPLDEIAYLITGPLGLSNRVSSDTWMHKACAEFSLSACPHLAYLKHERREGDMPSSTFESPGMDANKPKEIYLVKTDKYRIISPASQGVLINYRPLAFLRYDYVDNRLTCLSKWETVPLGVAWKNA